MLLNIYVILYTKKHIHCQKENTLNTKFEKREFAIVPGAGLTKDRKPSLVLSDRLDGALMLFEKGIVEKILVSGDHKGDEYSETKAMTEYLISKNVPEGKIYRDDKGFSTFETILRAKKDFNVKEAYFVSQRFHLPRMIYIGKKLGINALGLECNFHAYSRKKHTRWKAREIPSRVKDFFLATYYNLFKKI